eukprot:4084525-Pleurochrysis_carterae.AAC.2
MCTCGTARSKCFSSCVAKGGLHSWRVRGEGGVGLERERGWDRGRPGGNSRTESGGERGSQRDGET